MVARIAVRRPEGVRPRPVAERRLAVPRRMGGIEPVPSFSGPSRRWKATNPFTCVSWLSRPVHTASNAASCPRFTLKRFIVRYIGPSSRLELGGSSLHEGGKVNAATKAERPMRLFVGLGNPGAKYAGNRHNIGFMAVDRIAADHGFAPWRAKFQGLVAEGRLGTEKLALLKPETFMNLSGQSVAEALRFFKLTPATSPSSTTNSTCRPRGSR